MPPAHLSALTQDLASVDAVLLLGWRAAEPHAVALLGELKRHFSLGIVTMGDDGDEEIRDHLGTLYERAYPVLVETAGFSAFIENARVFLSDLLKAQLS